MEMEQSKPQFRHCSTIELNNHDTIHHESDAFIQDLATSRSSAKSVDNAEINLSSCDSMMLEPISQFNLNGTKKRSNYIECPQQDRQQQDENMMKIKSKKKASKSNNNRRLEAKKRPHFRIDWRQLSYYQRPHSFLSKCLANLDVFSPASSKSFDQKMKLADETRSEVSSLVTNSPVATSGGGGGSGINEDEPRQILNSLDGCFKSGELSAILGPSGAGKSTFLSTLFGSKQESAYGYTKVTWLNDRETDSTAIEGTSSPSMRTATPSDNHDNDDDYDERHRSLRIAFLPQHDHLLHHLTVYETLMFASKIKNHEKTGDERGGANGKDFHHFNVKRVAKMLKLTECLNTRCGKLSGGQYKRVSIGQELLSEPDVIILDEPTSGLDAMTCLTTVQTLKSIVTKHPMSIILTIHQPDNDVFSLFDKVFVIAQGGMAIYEGPPDGIFSTLAEVNLIPPRAGYNPARFIVENAFVPEPGAQDHLIGLIETNYQEDESTTVVSTSSSDDDDDDDDDVDDESRQSDEQTHGDHGLNEQKANYFKRSVQSLTDTIMGKETPFVRGSPFNKRDTIRRPLLNIGIRTLDGQLITSEQLATLKQRDTFSRQQEERIQLLKRLNQMQKARYEQQQISSNNNNSDDTTTKNPSKSKCTQTNDSSLSSGRDSSTMSSLSPTNSTTSTKEPNSNKLRNATSSVESDYSSASACSMMMACERKTKGVDEVTGLKSVPDQGSDVQTKSISLACLPASIDCPKVAAAAATTTTAAMETGRPLKSASNSLEAGLLHIETGHRKQEVVTHENNNKAISSNNNNKRDEFVVDFPDIVNHEQRRHEQQDGQQQRKLRRKFDKRLSAKHNCSKQTGYPIIKHALLLTHRTWLSIVRDPIFFGIQACMHTLIPIVLAAIFGSVQEEGCPRIGSFDLVDFAYSDSENLIQGTVRSIRQSIGNIGIVFFEMFVICFAINCITALVFPLDMYVLLKEYRNGWYSLRSYFMGRTLADLPVPVILHSIGMAILYFMTGQPHSLWRFSSIVLLVILASLVAQSVGLTIGALLMKSSQSAVLAAAGIVAPFFALSGFIVRIHTLPAMAQFAANASYLYHLLNGFIILRYGFGRCRCSEEDFEQNSAHQIPGNLHTMASMWIGTYSEEYANSSSVLAANTNHNSSRTNVDPNIDVVDKMMTAFKMANSYGHQIENCNDVLPYAMLDFNQRDQDIYYCFFALIIMLIITRLITFSAIYYKIRSFA